MDQRTMVRYCGKTRHATREAAVKNLASVMRGRRHRPTQGRLMEYWCRRCEAWHIGHGLPAAGRKRGDAA